MKTEDRHWTGDDEMLELFVLNRMSAAERAEAEHHLLTCEACRRVVRAEQELAAGIRRAGRDALKRKISSGAGRLTERETPWPKIISAAAMIGILTGVGIYNNWFASKEITPPTFTEEPLTTAKPDMADDRILRSDSNAPVQPKDEAKKETRAVSPEVREHLQKEKRHAEERFRDAVRRDASVGKKIQEQESASPAAESIPALRDELQAEESGALTGGIERDGVEQSEKSIWVEGTLSYAKENTAFGAQSYSYDKDIERSKTADHKLSARSEKQRNIAPADRQEIILKQQPAYSLPAARQQAQKAPGHEPIQTLVEQTAHGLQLTLFLPAGMTEEALRNANIQQIGDDSLIVNLPGQQIGYRLPAGWNLQKQGTGVRK